MNLQAHISCCQISFCFMTYHEAVCGQIFQTCAMCTPLAANCDKNPASRPCDPSAYQNRIPALTWNWQTSPFRIIYELSQKFETLRRDQIITGGVKTKTIAETMRCLAPHLVICVYIRIVLVFSKRSAKSCERAFIPVIPLAPLWRGSLSVL